jgi:hypothetical protein
MIEEPGSEIPLQTGKIRKTAVEWNTQIMKKILWTVLLSGAMNLSAFGALYRQTSGFQTVTAVPDGSTTGWSDTVLLNPAGEGSVPGDAYGSGSSVLDVTLATASPKIHSGFGDGTSGAVAPEGRNLEPLSVPSEFNSASTAVKFSSLAGQEPKGNGTLFFADGVSSGGESTAVRWTLDGPITPVPEPINVALGIFGALFLAGTLCRSERVQKLFAKLAPLEAE